MNTCVFDIETTDLGAVGAGIITCVGIRPLSTQRTRIFHLGMYDFEPSREYGFLEREERALLEAVREELSKAHIWIGHNIDKFDIPYLKSRAFRRQVVWDLCPFTYDTFKAFRRTGFLTRPNGYGKPSAGLAHVVDFAGIKQEKTPIYPAEWWESVWGNEAQRIEALQNVAEHCRHDVRMNALVWEMLWESDKRGTMRRCL